MRRNARKGERLIKFLGGRVLVFIKEIFAFPDWFILPLPRLNEEKRRSGKSAFCPTQILLGTVLRKPRLLGKIEIVMAIDLKVLCWLGDMVLQAWSSISKAAIESLPPL